MLATADCHDDLQPIAVGNQSAAVSAPRDDLAVSLHRHLLAFAVEPCEQRRHIERRVKALGVAGSLAALLAGSAAGATWWLAGGAVLGAAALWQVFAVLPLIRRLAGSKGRANPRNAAQIIARLAKLHAALSLAALAALFMFIMKA